MHTFAKLRFAIITILVSIFLSAISATPAFAQSPHFPITQLGGCRDTRECFYSCEVPQNAAACWSYDKYVLHKNVLGDSTQSAQSSEDAAKQHKIIFPIVELGNCASPQECMQYCSQSEHRDVCYVFGTKKGLFKNTKNAREMKHDQVNKEKMLKDAKEKLGCDGMAACQAFCSNPDNRQKCESFARSEGQQTSGHSFTPPAGMPCTTPESCSQWCQNNPDKCQTIKQQYLQQHQNPSSGSAPSSFTGPGGCTNEKDCMQFCQNHPEQCPGFPKVSSGTPTPPPIWTRPATTQPPATISPQQYQQYLQYKNQTQSVTQPPTGSSGNYPQQNSQPRSYPNYPNYPAH